jgi:hypothetical protein
MEATGMSITGETCGVDARRHRFSFAERRA